MKLNCVLTSKQFPKWKDFPGVIRILECGGGGDCMFHAVAAALTLIQKQPVSMEFVRKMLAESINVGNVSEFIKNMKADHKQQVLNGATDFNTVFRDDSNTLSSQEETVTLVRSLVRTQGTTFQGTDEVLFWIVKHSEFFGQNHLGFLLFTDHGPLFTTPIGVDARNFIMLFNVSNRHWMLAVLETEKGHQVAPDRETMLSMLSNFT